MTGRDRQQLALAFGQRDVQAFFAVFGALDQELQPKRGLPGPWPSLDEMGSVFRVAASKDIIEAVDARCDR